jgi:23S rRNA pseudouridine1911/1915/1917 synthase
MNTLTELPPLEVLYEDNHCLVVNKPARVLTMGDETGEPTLFQQAKQYLKEKYNKPGNVYLGVVHRLDRPTSGVVLFARTSKAASRLSDQLRRHAMTKTYHALVEGVPTPKSGRLSHWLLKDRDSNIVSVVQKSVADSQSAVLDYRLIKNEGKNSLLEVIPQTGRSHQIRVQLAEIGTPIVGDKKYGSSTLMGGKICLHAFALGFKHPTTKESVKVEATLPSYFS